MVVFLAHVYRYAGFFILTLSWLIINLFICQMLTDMWIIWIVPWSMWFFRNLRRLIRILFLYFGTFHTFLFVLIFIDDNFRKHLWFGEVFNSIMSSLSSEPRCCKLFASSSFTKVIFDINLISICLISLKFTLWISLAYVSRILSASSALLCKLIARSI